MVSPEQSLGKHRNFSRDNDPNLQDQKLNARREAFVVDTMRGFLESLSTQHGVAKEEIIEQMRELGSLDSVAEVLIEVYELLSFDSDEVYFEAFDVMLSQFPTVTLPTEVKEQLISELCSASLEQVRALIVDFQVPILEGENDQDGQSKNRAILTQLEEYVGAWEAAMNLFVEKILIEADSESRVAAASWEEPFDQDNLIYAVRESGKRCMVDGKKISLSQFAVAEVRPGESLPKIVPGSEITSPEANSKLLKLLLKKACFRPLVRSAFAECVANLQEAKYQEFCQWISDGAQKQVEENRLRAQEINSRIQERFIQLISKRCKDGPISIVRRLQVEAPVEAAVWMHKLQDPKSKRERNWDGVESLHELTFLLEPDGALSIDFSMQHEGEEIRTKFLLEQLESEDEKYLKLTSVDPRYNQETILHYIVSFFDTIALMPYDATSRELRSKQDTLFQELARMESIETFPEFLEWLNAALQKNTYSASSFADYEDDYDDEDAYDDYDEDDDDVALHDDIEVDDIENEVLAQLWTNELNEQFLMEMIGYNTYLLDPQVFDEAPDFPAVLEYCYQYEVSKLPGESYFSVAGSLAQNKDTMVSSYDLQKSAVIWEQSRN